MSYFPGIPFSKWSIFAIFFSSYYFYSLKMIFFYSPLFVNIFCFPIKGPLSHLTISYSMQADNNRTGWWVKWKTMAFILSCFTFFSFIDQFSLSLSLLVYHFFKMFFLFQIFLQLFTYFLWVFYIFLWFFLFFLLFLIVSFLFIQFLVFSFFTLFFI